MRTLRNVIAICLMAGFLLGAPAQAADTHVTLKVQTTDGTPLAFATYGFLPGCDEACGPYQTDAAGIGQFNVPPGDYTVFASSRGYSASSVEFMVTGDAPTDVVIQLPVGGTIRVSGLPVPTPGKMIKGRVTPYPVAASTRFFERFRLAAMEYRELEPGTAEVSGMAAGDYRVLFFLQGLEGTDSFRRAWYGGGLLMSSGQPIRVDQGQTTSIVAGEMPVSLSLPALAPPEVTAEPEGFTVTVRDPQGLGIGVGYEFQFRNATASGAWTPWGIYADAPLRLLNGQQITGTPGDVFEFRARAYGVGSWSEITSSEANQRASLAMSVGDASYRVSGDWSTPSGARLLPAKPTRPPKPATWLKGKKQILVWGPVLGATKYEARQRRNKGKWVTIKPRWTEKTQRGLPTHKAGVWRFQVRANNAGGSSPWSQTSKPLRVSR